MSSIAGIEGMLTKVQPGNRRTGDQLDRPVVIPRRVVQCDVVGLPA